MADGAHFDLRRVLDLACRLQEFEQLDIYGQTPDDEAIGDRDATIHQIEVEGVFVELESGRIDLAAGEEVDGALLVLHLYVLVVADEEARLSEFEDVLDVAHRADHLAGGHVLIVHTVGDRGALDLLCDAIFAQ